MQVLGKIDDSRAIIHLHRLDLFLKQHFMNIYDACYEQSFAGKNSNRFQHGVTTILDYILDVTVYHGHIPIFITIRNL